MYTFVRLNLFQFLIKKYVVCLFVWDPRIVDLWLFDPIDQDYAHRSKSLRALLSVLSVYFMPIDTLKRINVDIFGCQEKKANEGKK